MPVQDVWDRIHVLDSQLQDWMNHPAWLEEGRRSLQVLRDLLGQELDEQEVLTVIGICSTNAFRCGFKTWQEILPIYVNSKGSYIQI